ncbi:MAG: Na/Pi symporter [Tagaea sp.]|nr:Na/Pi symporter [Tagaea sp.]
MFVDSGTIAAALGGIGLFLLGMSMMTDGLKAAAGGALRDWLARGTRTVPRSLAVGFLITALMQSSSAVTVATIGMVNAGLLGLGQAVWLVFGTNVGTTMTGWIVAFAGVKLDVTALALPMIGLGMAARLAADGRDRIAGSGTAVAGFGLFFLGIFFLQTGFADAAGALVTRLPSEESFARTALLVAIGAALTVLMQSSSAALAVTLAASAGGGLELEALAAIVVGTNVGTTSTALFAALNATSAARRVAIAHIAFNFSTATIALAILPQLAGASSWLAGAATPGEPAMATLAVFHTLFNVMGVVLMLPAGGLLIQLLARMFADADEAIARPKHLDAGLAAIPALAAGGLLREGERHLAAAAKAALAAAGSGGGGPGRHRSIPPSAVRGLGGAIRAFVVRLGKSALPADVARALPHVLRASQHADALAAIDIPGAPSPAGPEWSGAAQYEFLRAAAMRCLELTSGARGEVEGVRLAADEADAAYEALKAALLSSSASGATNLQDFERTIEAARSLREAARLAWKAGRRLSAARDATASP